MTELGFQKESMVHRNSAHCRKYRLQNIYFTIFDQQIQCEALNYIHIKCLEFSIPQVLHYNIWVLLKFSLIPSLFGRSPIFHKTPVVQWMFNSGSRLIFHGTVPQICSCLCQCFYTCDSRGCPLCVIHWWHVMYRHYGWTTCGAELFPVTRIHVAKVHPWYAKSIFWRCVRVRLHYASIGWTWPHVAHGQVCMCDSRRCLLSGFRGVSCQHPGCMGPPVMEFMIYYYISKFK